jgi:hypothetical protein
MTEYEKLVEFIYDCLLSTTDVESYKNLSGDIEYIDLYSDLRNEMEEEIDNYLPELDQFNMYDKSIREKICQNWADSDERNFKSLCDFWAKDDRYIYEWAVTIAYKDAIDKLIVDIHTKGY